MKISLKAKAIFLIISVSALIGISAIVVYDRGISSLVTNDYESRSVEITRAMAQILDADKVRILRDNIIGIYKEVKDVVLSDQWGSEAFNEYVSRYSAIEDTPEFIYLRDQLRQVQDGIDVDCLYIVWIDVPYISTITHGLDGIIGIRHRNIPVTIRHSIFQNEISNSLLVEIRSPIRSFMFHGQM